MKPTAPTFAAALALTLAACGPNFRYVYDGEAAYERCYALDFDENASAQTRQQCWAAWLQSYSFGAGPDRVEYARAHAQPQPANTAPTFPASTASSPPATLPPSTAPAAPDVNARTASLPAMTPVTVAPDDNGRLTTMTPAASAWQRDQISVGGNPVGAPPPTTPQMAAETEPPGASCGHDCHDTWHACGGQCASGQAACVARCDDGYRACMRGCF